jgi:hypothetical protein
MIYIYVYSWLAIPITIFGFGFVHQKAVSETERDGGGRRWQSIL